MRTFLCSCGNQLFFDNVACMRCKREVGWCPECEAISDVTPDDSGTLVCSRCSTRLVKCSNYATYNVCNRFVKLADPMPALNGSSQPTSPQNANGQTSTCQPINGQAPANSGAPNATSNAPNSPPAADPPSQPGQAPTTPQAPPILCDSCCYNHTIPDLTV